MAESQSLKYHTYHRQGYKSLVDGATKDFRPLGARRIRFDGIEIDNYLVPRYGGIPLPETNAELTKKFLDRGKRPQELETHDDLMGLKPIEKLKYPNIVNIYPGFGGIDFEKHKGIIRAFVLTLPKKKGAVLVNSPNLETEKKNYLRKPTGEDLGDNASKLRDLFDDKVLITGSTDPVLQPWSTQSVVHSQQFSWNKHDLKSFKELEDVDLTKAKAANVTLSQAGPALALSQEFVGAFHPEAYDRFDSLAGPWLGGISGSMKQKKEGWKAIAEQVAGLSGRSSLSALKQKNIVAYLKDLGVDFEKLLRKHVTGVVAGDIFDAQGNIIENVRPKYVELGSAWGKEPPHTHNDGAVQTHGALLSFLGGNDLLRVLVPGDHWDLIGAAKPARIFLQALADVQQGKRTPKQIIGRPNFYLPQSYRSTPAEWQPVAIY